MKTFNQYLKAMGLMASALAFGACSDTWDDHYDQSGGVSGNSTSLWATIASNSELTNFARVIDSCGYRASLDGDQVFSVFAPTNAGFSSTQADSVITLYEQEKRSGVITKDNKAVKEFLQNHIALYNYSVAASGQDTAIVMMNGKYLTLGNASFDGRPLLTKNQLTRNGVLFTMKGTAEYKPNIFEYLSRDASLDSLSNFLYSYNVYEFDPNQSVPGEIVDGQTTYLDSVKVLKNDLLDYYIGTVNEEDSTYWMVVPNNSEWDRLLTQYQPYFNYGDKVEKRDSMQYLYSHMFIPNGSVFSMGWNTEQSMQDSAYSVNARSYTAREQIYGFKGAKYYVYDDPKPFEPGGVFYGAEKVKCSNGLVLKVPGWNIHPTQTFMRKIIVEAESSNYRKEYDENQSRIPSIVYVPSDNPPYYNQVSKHAYVELLSKSKDAKPSVTYYIPDVLSNVPYDIKLVMAPAIAGDSLATEEQRKLLMVNVELGYQNQNGRETTTKLLNRKECKKDAVDTLLVAKDFKFPTCTYGIDPQVTLKITSSGRPPGSRKEKYQTSLRIDCIILEPKEEN